MSEKCCAKCGQTKDVSEFHREPRALDGLKTYCRTCVAAYHKAYRLRPEVKRRRTEANRVYRKAYDQRPESRALKRNHLLKNKYGITSDDYDRMLEEQGGRCAICGTDKPQGMHRRLNVDHDHKTGVVRGLVCYECNVGLGKFRDDTDVLRNAIRYLERFGEEQA
jgi:hypothetical protein